MKKLFALLLAMMMPLCAMAETFSLSLSVDTDDVLFPAYLKQALLENPGEVPADQVDACVKLTKHLLDGLGLKVTMQETAFALDVQVAGSNLIDLVFHEAEDAMYLTSTLLPGYALTDQISFTAEDERSLISAIDSIDWKTLGDDVINAFNAWLAIEPYVATGAYAGDAYSGGKTCTTWTFTDKDIAQLVSAAISKEVRQAIEIVCTSLDVEAAKLFASIDEKNAAVAAADTYMYVLRVVEDEAGALRGISLTIIEDVEQVATLSLGFTKKEVNLVLGLGLEEQNYWWQFTAKKSQRNNLTLLSGTNREWMADKLQSFSYVQTANAPLTDLGWQCNITKSGNRYLWDASVFEDNGQSNSRLIYMTTNGTVIPKANTLDCTISIGYAPDIPVKFNVSFAPAEAIAPLDASLQKCSLSAAEDQQLSQELSDKFAASIMARLIKIVPVDVIMMLNQMMMTP